MFNNIFMKYLIIISLEITITIIIDIISHSSILWYIYNIIRFLFIIYLLLNISWYLIFVDECLLVLYIILNNLYNYIFVMFSPFHKHLYYHNDYFMLDYKLFWFPKNLINIYDTNNLIMFIIISLFIIRPFIIIDIDFIKIEFNMKLKWMIKMNDLKKQIYQIRRKIEQKECYIIQKSRVNPEKLKNF